MPLFRFPPLVARLPFLRVLGLVALTALPRPLLAQEQGIDQETNYAACLKQTFKDPERALVTARQWSDQGGGAAAEHCTALALIGLGRNVEAAERLEVLAGSLGEKQAHLRADILAQAGQAWFLANKLQKAASLQSQALDLRPGEIEFWIDRALTLAANAQYWEAIDDLNQANTLDPERADVLIYRANAYRYLEAYDLAMEDVQAALNLEPGSVEALLERGNIFRLLGQEEAARDDWVRVTTQAPNSPAAAAAQANLERLDVRKD